MTGTERRKGRKEKEYVSYTFLQGDECFARTSFLLSRMAIKALIIKGTQVKKKKKKAGQRVACATSGS